MGCWNEEQGGTSLFVREILCLGKLNNKNLMKREKGGGREN